MLKDSEEMDVNRGAECGTMSTGGGHAQLEEMMSAMNIPTMSAKIFHDDVCYGWEATALNEMDSATEEKARLAVVAGDVDRDEAPVITVIADARRSKRSCRTNSSALLSGEVSTEVRLAMEE
ncbi:hypothetical protein PR048_022660 [Dryococelus australis]|uniref:Mutator-like transposase domain-containing protein n=1 Tax=Dryococelus australis TaxID=614101 RepID=A0ABQ9H1M5_9NEOP|nr:hypothetical protein PR048_022660 [Dryococelus australis]